VESDPEEPSRPGVVVDLVTNSKEVRIVRLDGGRQTIVCAPPCGESLPREGVYQIAGDGVVPTAKFTLPKDESNLQIQVRAGSEGVSTTGIVLTAGGLTTLVAGYAYVLDKVLTMPLDMPGNPRPLQVAVAVGGAGALIAGVGVLLTLTARTNVTTSRGVTFSQAPERRRRTALRLTVRGLEF
jgi:hypothetical protein